MHGRLQARFVKDLVQDIALLSGGNFETLGYAVIEGMRPATQGAWIHPGTNLAGAPVKATVDSSADAGDVVAQYTSDAGFFSAPMKKAKADISQAKAKHANMKELWLLSSRRASPGERKTATNLEASHRAQGLQLTIVDARAIAKHIIERLDDEIFIESIRPFLSSLRRIEDEYAYTHAIPVDAQYVSRPEESRYEAELHASRLTEISGMSGVGKSALAANLVNRLRRKFEIAVWIDASDIRSIEQLLATDVRRRGSSINLVGLLKRRICLLVLDDLQHALALDRLLASAHPGSRLIVTSQYTSPGSAPLSMLGEQVGRQVLEAHGPTPCPTEVFDLLWSRAGGHAGALTLLAGLAQTDRDGWDSALQASEDPGGLEDERYQRLADRILQRHRIQLSTEFELLAVAGTSRVDLEVWQRVCGPGSLRAMGKRGLLAASTDTTVRVHDLVFASTRKLHDEPSAAIVAAISRCVEDLDRNKDERLDRIARAHEEMFDRLAGRPDATAAVRYAFAHARPRNRDSVFAAAIAEACALAGSSFEVSMTIKLRAALEAIEAHYQSTKQAAIEADRSAADAKSEAQNALAAHLQAFDRMATIRNLPVDLVRELKHHRAKAIYWLGRTDEARGAFEEVILEDPDHAAARLQLARIHAERSESEEARRHIVAILDLPRQDGRKTLAAFAELKKAPLKGHLLDVITRYEPLFVDCLDRSLALGSDQAVGVVASLGTELWYEAQALLGRVARIVHRSHFSPSKRSVFDWAQCLKHCAKAILKDDQAAAHSMLTEARDAYARSDKRTSFAATQHAECLLLLRDGAGAANVLDAIPVHDRNAHWHHRRAQSYRLLGQLDSARTEIDAALGAVDPKFKSALLYERFLIRDAAGDRASTDDLHEAIASCNNPRYKLELEAELNGRAAAVGPAS